MIWSGALLTFIGFLSLWTWNMSSKVEEEAQSLSVPMCVDYIKIRVGEWTMVMLGETAWPFINDSAKRAAAQNAPPANNRSSI